MFKKLPLLLFAATCLVAFIINSCKKDAHPDQQNKVSDPAIAQAKSWYESTYPTGNKLNSLATTGNKDLSQLIKPDWQHTASYSRFNQQVIEMPVDPSVKFASAIKNMTTGQITNNAYSRSSFILLNNGTGYDAYVMTLIADSVYIKNDLSKLTRNTYSKREADFSGLVLYFTPKGKYVSGWRYKDGHIVIPGAGTPNKKVQDIAGPKLTPHNMEPTEDCIDWFWVTYDNGVPIDYQYLYTTCATPGQGGGGDAGNTPPDCPPGTSRTQSTGHLAVNNMPPPPPDDGGGGGFPSPTTPGPCTVDAPATITNNVKDPCLKKMVDSTISKNVTNQINSLIQNVFGGSTSVNLEFTDVTTLPPVADGYTPPNNGIVNGRLDAQIQLDVNHLPNYSQEYIARVIMHESLHAYLDAKGISDQLQHEDIMVNYVTKMASSLQQMFPGLSSTDAKNLALGGLQTTDAFQNKIAKDLGLESTFVSTNLAYSVGASGTRCNTK